MKKVIITFLLLLTGILCWGQFIWDEPGVWVGQEKMIHADNYYIDLFSVAVEGGFVVLWLESEMGAAQIYGQKFTISGEAVWQNPVQLTSGDIAPYLSSAISDSENNIILAYYYKGDINTIWLMKVSSSGEIVWQRELEEAENSCLEVSLKTGLNNDFYLCYQYGDEDQPFSTFYYYDEDSNIIEGWEDGISPGSLDDNSWQIDNEGNLVTLYLDEVSNIFLQRYDQSGNEVFPEGILLIEETPSVQYIKLLLQITPVGMYLVNVDNMTYYIDQTGEIEWEYDNDSYAWSKSLIAGVNSYYILEDMFWVFNIYQYDYDHNLVWEYQNYYDYGIYGAWIDENEDFRFVERQTNDMERYEYKLMEFDHEGNLISPIEGWINEEVLIDSYYLNCIAGDNGEIIWIQKQKSISMIQDMSFYTVSDEGTILTGAESVMIGTGMEWRMRPLEIYVNEEIESILVEYPGIPGSSFGHERILLQRLDRNGELLGEEPVQILFPNYTCLLSRDDNLALFYINDYSDERYLQLVDLATGEYLWEEPGVLFPPEFTTTLLAGDVRDGVVTYYWHTVGNQMGTQRIVDGEPVFPNGGLLFTLNSSPFCGQIVSGPYLIAASTGNHHYVVDYLGEEDVLWEVYAGGMLTRDVKENFVLVDEGLLVLFAHAYPTGADLGCHLISETGELVWGEGVSLFIDEDDTIYGIVEFEDSYGVITYNTTSGEEAKFWRFDQAGTLLVDGINLPGSENCEICQVKAIEDGMAVLMTEEEGQSNDLMLGYYDLTGNLQNTGQENPVLCYQEFSHNTAVVADVYDNDIYMIWQSLINNFSNSINKVKDVILQGWSVPEVDNDEEVINHTHSSLSLMPNPFNPELKISWSLANTDCESTISIYNIKGQKVWSQSISETHKSVIWEGKETSGRQCSSGVYLIRLQNGEESISRKALLLK
ncbi:MAG: T9SS type A sorting domain-containing protein [Candidatus Cloacimonetes bacterium]|nr:T9SS type A sorting domain-containing protein [Candidatus Cloacimonadota bacterium]